MLRGGICTRQAGPNVSFRCDRFPRNIIKKDSMATSPTRNETKRKERSYNAKTGNTDQYGVRARYDNG